jgi:glycerol kinase
VRQHWQIERTFQPRMAEAEATRRRHRWNEALKRSLDWEQHATG